MADLEALALNILKQTARLNDNEIELNKPGQTDIPTLDQRSEDARNDLIASLRALEAMVLGPKDTVQNQYYRVCPSPEFGFDIALMDCRVRRLVSFRRFAN